MEYLILAVVALVILMLPVLGLVAFSFLAVVIFVWRKMFPLGWGIAEWVTNRRNLIPFVLFLLILIAGSIILIIVSYIFASQVHWVGYLFLLLFVLILAIAEIIFWGGVGLAVILWIVRLSHWGYALFRRGFWRTFRPGGGPDFQPVPVPLTNPVLRTPPSLKRTGNRRRQPLAKRRVISSTSLAPSPKEKAQLKEEAKKVEEQAREAKRNQTIADAEGKAQAKEKAKKAEEQARKAKRNQAIADAAGKARANEEAKQNIAEEKSGEITNPGRRRRLKRNREQIDI